ncbi:MAG: 3-phosphoshikimate 1-carboxyvinyltransferase [Planctomycetia bacterium]|nr:3-phosphoshikimate 1-carboxyvinyltransferase [Planctomycetia bacterium]
MPDSVRELEITPVAGPVRGSIRPPGSKSITNRALVCAALAEGQSTLDGALVSEDTQVMVDSLERLGIAVVADWPARRLTVTGCGGRIPAAEAELFVGNSGTTIRFLAAVAALGHGSYRLDGVPRMRQRPIGDLITALRQLGVEAKAESPGDCPPVLLKANGLRGGQVTVRGDVSSQFLSGLLLASPCARTPVEIRVDGTLVSLPYVTMTLDVMRAFGVSVIDEGHEQFNIAAPSQYQPRTYSIEPDASAASYFWAAAAITGGQVRVDGLSLDSLQGDVRFCDLLVQMGCRVEYAGDGTTLIGAPQQGSNLKGINANMNAISDTVPTLAVVALFAEGPTTIRGVAHIRHKETDRIGDLATELRKLGAEVETFDDGLRITPGKLRAARLETYQDHRMAMSLALAGLRQPGVVILDPGCTAKTYPDYFRDLERLVRP